MTSTKSYLAEAVEREQLVVFAYGTKTNRLT